MSKPNSDAQKTTKYKVKVTKNGPYLVSGGVPLSEQSMCVDTDGQCHGWKEGKKYPEQDNYALCRCGRSHNKPFCDGNHTEVRFDGTEKATYSPYLQQASVINGPGLKLTDAEDFCAAGRFCHRAGGTWELTEQSSNPDARKIAIEEACDCPSGRLVAWDQNGNTIEPDFEPYIGLIEDTQAGKWAPYGFGVVFPLSRLMALRMKYATV